MPYDRGLPADRLSMPSLRPEALRAQLLMAAAAAGLYVLAALANQWLFSTIEFMRGIHWIYLPAGVRLLCVLLFAGSGAAGLVFGGWIVGFWLYFPGDVTRSFMGGILSAAGPYLVYQAARWRYGLQRSLVDLTGGRLLALAVACSLVTPLLHHLWFLAVGRPGDLHSMGVMFIGDLAGTIIMLYSIRFLLVLAPRRAR